VTEDAVLPVGTTLSAAHFVPGQHVDVSGDSWVLDLVKIVKAIERTTSDNVLLLILIGSGRVSRER
jgi:hypothetical protein